MRKLTIAVALLALVACSKDKDVDKPALLVGFPATLSVQRAWAASVGGIKTPMRLGLGLAVLNGKVYAAGRGGEVAAFDVATGHRVWEARTKLGLGGGTGVDDDLVVVGSTDGDVVALGTSDGAQRWHTNVGAEILSAAAVTPRIVVVRAVDGKLHGLAPTDGHELWQLQQPVPRLSLRGTSHPEMAGDLAICGFDNGKLVAANIIDGTSAWETVIEPPHGKTELERLVDVDAAARIAGNDVYVVGFQGKVAMLALDTGQIWWSHEASSYRGLDIDDDAIYVSTAEGDVIALRRRTGAELWRQSALAHRGLSAPAVASNAIIVADYQGYVHWLDKASGAIIGRAQSGKARVTNPPVAVEDRVLVINDRGEISAFQAKPLAAAEHAKPNGKVR
jgi:outer membrane protein assembly factor BamB